MDQNIDGNEADAFKSMFKENPNPKPRDFEAKSYSLSGKIMLSAIVFLFFVVVIMLFLHVYARWYLRLARRRHRRRRTQLVFHSDVVNTAAPRGLDAAVLASLPVFSYDPKTRPGNAPECAVCLSEFEPGEPGRVLPKCKHSFHTECIDMWFHSHATCPLCRAPVELANEPEVVITVNEPPPEPETGSRSLEDANQAGSSLVGERRKPSLVGVSVEVPPGDESSGFDSPSTQSSFRSPMSRMLSFTRMLGREKKGSLSPSSCGGGGACSSAAETGETTH
ncbi:hypothetical protein Fmac_009724 [Flemingia macrophylla]|uniref:RING-type E3 ubiquitin transferase n=1 Tax=Flemingia macrophylla TaxID=520843 RepID=A0ABD1N147_9FABA